MESLPVIPSIVNPEIEKVQRSIRERIDDRGYFDSKDFYTYRPLLDAILGRNITRPDGWLA